MIAFARLLSRVCDLFSWIWSELSAREITTIDVTQMIVCPIEVRSWFTSRPGAIPSQTRPSIAGAATARLLFVWIACHLNPQ